MVDLQQIVDTLASLDEDNAVNVITSVLSARPELAPPVVNFAVPDLTYPPAKCLAERRSSGVIKSYNEEKGYGFIACQELQEVFGNDVFLHSKQNQGGYKTGQQVSFAVVLNKDQKPQAFDLQISYGKGGKGGGGGGMMGGGDPMQQMMMGMMGGCDPMQQMQQMMMMKGGMGDMGGMGGMGGGMGGKGGKDFGKGGKDFGKDNKRPLGGGCGKGSKGPDEAEVLGQFHGTIKSFNQANGYGFIDCPEIKMQYGKDIFLHHAQLGGFDVGEQVMFTAYLNSKGQPQGKNLVGVDGGPAKKMRHG